MSWIKTVPYVDSAGLLRELYDRVKGRGGHIDNILTAHGLRPASLEGHMTLYKNVLHHRGNALEKWRLEMLGVYVSHLNGCDYCVAHHFAGLRRLLNDEARANDFFKAMNAGDFSAVADARQRALLDYARKLTGTPRSMSEADVAALRAEGLDDGEILEANQVIAYFNYANRTVQGLGVTSDGEILGLSPGNDDAPDDWSHDVAKA